ncbi:MAG: ISL3 family transposase [Chloroflexota bacterium]|nr:ISL3 family transposase [Chloroflexota bacterium]
MACPECHQLSTRIHGAYQRTVADLPCAGRDVMLLFTVRKFVCGTSTCPQRIFTERLPELVESYARMTTRLLALVQTIGLVAGGQCGTRLAERLGITMPASTLLLHVMKLSPPSTQPVRVLGVDDWSWKKGRRYGAILVDLERHTIIDLLPDRSSETFAKWLCKHLEVEIISRDRGTEFAAAARTAAPQARQIADRFHIVHNLAEALESLLARCRTDIRRANQEILPEDLPLPEKCAASLPSSQTWRQQPSSRAERIYEAHRAEREDRYRQIAALRGQGMTHTAIAQRVGVSTYKVRSWLKQEGAPVHRRPQGHDSLFDPYAVYVLDRWQAGVQDGKQLYEEIRQQGYSGSLRLVRLFLQPVREHRQKPEDIVAPSPVEQFSARDAVWLFIREKSKLTAEEQEELLSIRSASVTIETVYGLVQEFLTMVRKRQGERLNTWIEAVRASQIPE